jgi:hypothetical protein
MLISYSTLCAHSAFKIGEDESMEPWRVMPRRMSAEEPKEEPEAEPVPEPEWARPEVQLASDGC